MNEERKYARINKDDFYFQIVESVSKRGTCDRGRNGAIIVSREGRILSTGYVGSPNDEPHCDDVGHQMADGHCIRTVHAEMNAIIQCARFGIIVGDAILYTKMFPCYNCAKVIVNVGIGSVMALYDYRGSEISIELFRRRLVHYEIYNPGNFLYP